jgi:hypothetical protein
MGRQRKNQISSDNLIGLDEASRILELTEDEVGELITDHQLMAFRIGDNIVRLRKDQVWEFQSKRRIEAGLFPDDRDKHTHDNVEFKATFQEIARDFVYYNDFYIICALIIAALLYLILSSHVS